MRSKSGNKFYDKRPLLADFSMGKLLKSVQTQYKTIKHSQRHPGDIIRMVLAALVFGTATAIALAHKLSTQEAAVFRVANDLPNFLSPVLVTIMQAGAFYFVFIAASIALIFKRFRLTLKMLVGGLTVWLLAKVAKDLVERKRPFYLLHNVAQRAINSGILGFPSGHAAVASLLATVTAPYVSKNWSRLFWAVALTVGIARMYVGAHLPLDVIAGLSMGWFIGSLINLAIGTPAKELPLPAIKHALNNAGLKVTELVKAQVDARSSTPIFAETLEGKKLFIKLIDTENRNADVLYRLWRYVALRGVEDEAPFASAKQIAEHEAYVSIQASQAGVRTPDVILATSTTSKSAMIVNQKIDGNILSDFKGEINEQLLRTIWQDVAKLHENKIAHRDLRATNILIDQSRRPWLIDFSFAETAASTRQLQEDIIELMVSTAVLTNNPQLAVSSAIAVLGADKVKPTLPYIQPLVLTYATRASLKHRPELLKQVVSEVMTQTNSRPVPRARVGRFDYKWLMLIGIVGLSMYYLLPRLAELDGSLKVLRAADLRWLLLALLISGGTYVMSAIVVLGSTEKPLSYGYTLILQAATTVLNRITPKGIGGVALTEQYLEKSGLERFEASASVSIIYGSGIIVHSLLLLVIIATVHPVGLQLFHLTNKQLVLLVVMGALIAVSVFVLPRFKRLLHLWSGETVKGLRHVFVHPIKFLQLFGGSAGVTIAYALTLYFSVKAFGPILPIGTILLVYLAGSALAAASPTPGGLGTTEAALILGLSVAGTPLSQAVVSVLVFRLLTFWLPILPGFFALRFVTTKLIST